MGVRGLTTYIAKNAEKYLIAYELHDCDLVIDGDNLASNLYQWASNINSAFGGNYDQYFRFVCNFFVLLKKCNVKPYVLLDGGCERRKLRTVKSRLRSKISGIKHLNLYRNRSTFPILMREVFVEALEHCKVHIMRCVFEADEEVAILAQKLNCPVLSYDSDFYIFDVKYIPAVTLTRKVYKKTEIIDPKYRGIAPKRGGCKKKMLVQEMHKTSGDLIVKKEIEDPNAILTKTYYYIDCSLYTLSNLVNSKGLSNDMIPLFAVLIGNDYIQGSLFRKFFANISMKETGKKTSQQGKRIVAILLWLKNQTLESAITKVLSRVEKNRRAWLQKQIESAMDGYKSKESVAYKYFGFKELPSNLDEKIKTILTVDVNDSVFAADDDSSDNETITDEDSIHSSDADVIDEEDEVPINEQETQENATDNTELSKNDSKDDDILEESDDYDDDDRETDPDIVYESYNPPEWICKIWKSAKLPRHVIDLLHLKLYVNSPQVENFSFPDAHEIALPILQLIFTILHYPKQPTLSYLTRVQRISNIHYKHIACINDKLPFDSLQKDNFETFKLAFKEFNNINRILEVVVKDVPANSQLYVLAIIYWAKYSKHVVPANIHSVIICLIVLNIIDKSIEPMRFQEVFRRKYNKLLKNTNSIVKHEQGVSVGVANQRVSLHKLIATVKKLECILALDKLINYFALSPNLRSKHNPISSTILHTYAELQAIIFQLNCLNTLCGSKFENVRISNFFNGTFLYNIFEQIKDRPNIPYYVAKFIFGNSPKLLQIYESLIDVLTPFVACLQPKDNQQQKLSRNARKKRNRKAKLNANSATAAEQQQNSKTETVKSENTFTNNCFEILDD